MTVNMDYCKFENTYKALQECWSDCEEHEGTEETYRKNIVTMCINILEAEGYSVEADFVEE